MLSHLREQNILFFARGMGIGGTENVILQMCQVLKPYVNKIVICSCGGESVKQLETMKIKHYVIPDICNKNPKIMWSVLQTVKRVVKEENITVIHVHDRMAAFYVALLHLKNVRYFVTVHINTKNKRFLTRFSYKKANLIACGNGVRDTLIEYYGLSQHKIAVVRNVITEVVTQINLDDVLTAYKNNGNLIVGNVGRLTEQKGILYFLDSFNEVKQKIPNVKYVIVGDGVLKKNLEDYAIKLNISQDVLFMGYRADARELMSQMDVVVLSSIFVEGFPLTPIEAFSNGKPVIGTNVSGTNEIITDRINGCLVPPADSKAISQAIIEILSNNKLREQMGQCGYQTYREEFSAQRYAKEVIDFYKKNIELGV